MKPIYQLAATWLLALLATACARADVRLASVFGDHAVLQRGKPVPIWGRAAPGEGITLLFAGQRVATRADADGRWSVHLAPLETAVTGSELTVRATNTIILRDVLVGEVWMCSGQSNMNFNLERELHAATEIAAADFPLIRELRVPFRTAETPQEEFAAEWRSASPSTAGGFTAVGFFFAREIFQKLGVPLGILRVTQGGTGIEAWSSTESLASDPAFAVIDQRWKRIQDEYPAKKTKYDAELSEWTAREDVARREGEKALASFHERSPKPVAPWGAQPGDKGTPRGLFNGMVHPVIPYALRGILWYQGESNTGRPDEYHKLFTTLIDDWRARFHQGALPFFWVQLPNFQAPAWQDWASLRDVQARALKVSGTGMAVAIDIGDRDDIHPRNKRDVGHRLALIAGARIYSLGEEDSGPVFRGATRDGRAMRVRFSHADGLTSRDGPPQSLEVAGADRRFFAAEAIIDAQSLLVSTPQVPEPVAVRYAWSNAPIANVYNGAGLPAAPFRSDDWKSQPSSR